MIFLRRTPAPVGLATTPTRLALDYRSEQEKPIFGRAPSLAPAVTDELSALRSRRQETPRDRARREDGGGVRGYFLAALLLLTGSAVVQTGFASLVGSAWATDRTFLGFELLDLENQTVKWRSPRMGVGAAVTYAFATEAVDTPGAGSIDAAQPESASRKRLRNVGRLGVVRRAARRSPSWAHGCTRGPCSSARDAIAAHSKSCNESRSRSSCRRWPRAARP